MSDKRKKIDIDFIFNKIKPVMKQNYLNKRKGDIHLIQNNKQIHEMLLNEGINISYSYLNIIVKKIRDSNNY